MSDEKKVPWVPDGSETSAPSEAIVSLDVTPIVPGTVIDVNDPVPDEDDF